MTDSRSKVTHSIYRVLGAMLVVLTMSAGLASVTGGSAGARTRRPVKPGPPTNLTLVVKGLGVWVSWSPPVSDGGSPIIGYTVTYKGRAFQGAVNGVVCEIPTGPTSCIFGGFRRPIAYPIGVRAVNAINHGKPTKGTAYVSSNDFNPNCAYLGPFAVLTGCNLAGASLSGLNLSASRMTNVDLSGADLSGSTLGEVVGGTSCLLSELSVDMGGDNLSNANLTGATVCGVLAGANLTGANLTNANLTGSSFYLTIGPPDEATLTNVVWSNTTCPDGTNSDADGGTCANNLGSGAP